MNENNLQINNIKNESCKNYNLSPTCYGWIIDETNKTFTNCIFCNYTGMKQLKEWMFDSNSSYTMVLPSIDVSKLDKEMLSE